MVLQVQNLSNSGYFGGHSNAEVSARFPTAITPASWAFSIWPVIFSLQLAAVVYSCLSSRSENSQVSGIGLTAHAHRSAQSRHQLFPATATAPPVSQGWKTCEVAACFPYWCAGWVCECVWQLCFGHATPAAMLLATVPILGALAAFQLALSNLHALQTPAQPALPSLTYALFWVPTSLNAAWLSVASAVQIVIALQTNTRLPATPAAVALALVVLGFGITLTYLHKVRRVVEAQRTCNAT